MNTRFDERFFQSTRGRLVTLLRGTTGTVGELAEALGVTDNAVRVRLHRGLERLEQLLKARLAKKEAGAGETSE